MVFSFMILTCITIFHDIFIDFINDFAHIPWEDTPNFPRKKEIPKQKLLVKFLGYLPGVPVGENLDFRLFGSPKPSCLPLIWGPAPPWEISPEGLGLHQAQSRKRSGEVAQRCFGERKRLGEKSRI